MINMNVPFHSSKSEKYFNNLETGQLFLENTLQKQTKHHFKNKQNEFHDIEYLSAPHKNVWFVIITLVFTGYSAARSLHAGFTYSRVLHEILNNINSIDVNELYRLQKSIVDP